jgi:hydrogenase maturation protease
MKPILVVGYGNPLRRDDGAGARAAQELADRWPESAMHVEISHQLLIEQAAALAEADYVVFIDAAKGPAPGTVRWRAVSPGSPDSGSMTHFLTPETLLGASRQLYGRCPEAALVSIDGADFGLGEELSPLVLSALPQAVAQAERLIQCRLHEAGHA